LRDVTVALDFDIAAAHRLYIEEEKREARRLAATLEAGAVRDYGECNGVR